jgi:hypothetical protein
VHDEIGDADIYEKVDEGIPGGMTVQSPTEEGQARWLFRGLGHHPVGADAGVSSPVYPGSDSTGMLWLLPKGIWK